MNTPVAGTTISMSSSNGAGAVTKVGGFSTLPDGLSYGPAEVFYTVTNNNSTGSPVLTNINYTVTWPGPANCGGSLATTDSYAGTVTLLP